MVNQRYELSTDMINNNNNLKIYTEGNTIRPSSKLGVMSL